MAGNEFEVYALKFAEHPGGPRGSFFFGPVEQPDDPIALDYFFWLMRSPDHTILLDVGFTATTAQRRGRPHMREPHEALANFGVDPKEVSMVIMSHLHYDHAGDWGPFENATFVLQDSELAFWTGRHLSRRTLRWLVELDDIQAYVRLNHEGRIRFVDGDEELVPGLSVHRVGGHTPGSQVVRLSTSSGNVVLASDVVAMYENLEADAPFGILTDVPASLDVFYRVTSLADSPDLIVPGHDPAVFERFDEVEGQQGLTVRIA